MKKGIKGILTAGLALIMSFGLAITSFAISDADYTEILNAVSEGVELENGTNIKIPDKVKSEIQRHLRTNDISEEQAKEILQGINQCKEIIKNSKVESQAELKTKINTDVDFDSELTNALNKTLKAAGAGELNSSVKKTLEAVKEGKEIYETIKPVKQETDPEEDTNVTAVASVPVVPQVTGSLVNVPVVPQVTGSSVDVSIKKTDGTTVSLNEPIIKTTGYNFAVTAVVVAAAIALVAGCVVIARKKNLFN